MLISMQIIFRREIVDEDIPDGNPASLIQSRQAEGDVDAGLEGLIEGADAVGGEEEDARKII